MECCVCEKKITFREVSKYGCEICGRCYRDHKKLEKGEQDEDVLKQREDDFREGLEDRAETRNNDMRGDV